MKRTYILIILFLSFLFNSCDNDESALPVIGIVSPTENEVFYVGESITININTNDPDGIIERVLLKVNDQQINEFNFEPYSYVWSTDGYPAGVYNIEATAIDNDGLSSSTSTQITLDVENPQIVTLPISFTGTTNIHSGILIQSNGSPPIIEKGLCWNQIGNPTVNDNVILVENAENPIIISSLDVDTEYHVRAFADNGISITYGETFSTTTLSTYINDTGFIIDSRDGITYNWVEIGDQRWFSQNLIFQDGLDINSYIETPYGLVYGVPPNCPDGWHMPSEEEWNQLIEFVGGNQVAGGILKETGIDNWIAPNTGANNTAGFFALPAGYAIVSGGSTWENVELENLNKTASFWTDNSSIKVFQIRWDQESIGTTFYGNGTIWSSCRCVKD